MIETGRHPSPLLILDACSEHEVPTIWGLELLLELVRSGGLDHKSVIDIARQIHTNNPRHISAKVLAEIEKKLPSR